jgi:hypothetical protein
MSHLQAALSLLLLLLQHPLKLSNSPNKALAGLQ